MVGGLMAPWNASPPTSESSMYTSPTWPCPRRVGRTSATPGLTQSCLIGTRPNSPRPRRPLSNQAVTLVKSKPSAVMCMEADPARCHRTRLADHMSAITGLPVAELPSHEAHRVPARRRPDNRHDVSAPLSRIPGTGVYGWHHAISRVGALVSSRLPVSRSAPAIPQVPVDQCRLGGPRRRERQSRREPPPRPGFHSRSRTATFRQ